MERTIGRERSGSLGHEVKLMSPRFVRPYVKSNKNDARDAEAICEAVARPSMRFVAVKSQTQQDVLALHRVRALLIRERTALMNQMRGLLAECGSLWRRGPPLCVGHWRRSWEIAISSRARFSAEALVEMSERLRSFEERLERYDRRIGKLARSDSQRRPVDGGPRGRATDRHRADRHRRRCATV